MWLNASVCSHTKQLGKGFRVSGDGDLELSEEEMADPSPQSAEVNMESCQHEECCHAVVW